MVKAHILVCHNCRLFIRGPIGAKPHCFKCGHRYLYVSGSNEEVTEYTEREKLLEEIRF